MKLDINVSSLLIGQEGYVMLLDYIPMPKLGQYTVAIADVSIDSLLTEIQRQLIANQPSEVTFKVSNIPTTSKYQARKVVQDYLKKRKSQLKK